MIPVDAGRRAFQGSAPESIDDRLPPLRTLSQALEQARPPHSFTHPYSLDESAEQDERTSSLAARRRRSSSPPLSKPHDERLVLTTSLPGHDSGTPSRDPMSRGISFHSSTSPLPAAASSSPPPAGPPTGRRPPSKALSAISFEWVPDWLPPPLRPPPPPPPLSQGFQRRTYVQPLPSPAQLEGGQQGRGDETLDFRASGLDLHRMDCGWGKWIGLAWAREVASVGLWLVSLLCPFLYESPRLQRS